MNKDLIKRIIDTIKKILSNKKIILGTIIFVSLILIIAIVTILFAASKNNAYTVDTLKEYNWNDFIISIDGHQITYETTMSELEEIGFILQDKAYDINIEPNFNTGGILYSYKNENDKYNIIFLAAHNNSNKPQFFKKCQLSGIDFNQNFYQNYRVILPKGILLDNDLTIDKIIEQWGKPSQANQNSYQWIEKEHMIKIYTNDDDTILNVVYE